MSRVRNLIDYQSQTADLDGDATRDLNISGTVTAGAVASANVPDVNLTIAPEVLEIQVDAPDMGQDIMWKWTWEQSTLPYARRTITNSAELNVPLYKEGTYAVNNFAAYDIHGSMTQTHSLYLKWVNSAGTDNLVSWATSTGPISDTHPDINGGTATDVQRITVNVPATITPPSLTNPSVAYTVTNTASGSYTFSGSAKGDNPNLGPFYRGGTYTINITATGHPFYFTTDNGTNFSAGTYFGEYTSGVTGSRTDSGTITFTVPAGAPDTLYYQCGNHGVMRGEITVKDLAVETNINGNYVVYFQHTQEGHATPVELRPIPSLVNQMCIVYDANSGKFVPQDLTTYVENTPSFENKIREVAGTAELVVADGSAVIAKVNVYDDSTYLPLTGNNPGDQAFATDTDVLYIWDGSAWQQAGAVTVAGDGNVLIGTDIGDSFNADSRLRIGNSGDRAFLQFKTDASNDSGILFGTEADDVRHQIIHNVTDDALTFIGNSAEAMRIDSSGNLLVGYTGIPDDIPSTSTVDGLAYSANDFLAVSRSGSAGQACLILNKLTNDGDIAQFRKDGTTVGRIGASGSEVYIGNGDTGLKFNSANDYIQPFNVDGVAGRADAIDIGSIVNRFKDLYLSGTAIVNAVGNRGNIMRYFSDSDSSSSNAYGHLFYTNQNMDVADINAATPEFGLYNNDLYVKDNISAGRVYKGDGTLVYNSDGTASITAYGSDTTTGHKCYTQITGRNSTDPDYGCFIANSRYVESQSNDTGDTDHNSHVLTNGGHHFMWMSVFAGRSRRGDAGTTSNYRAADASLNAYSNTGGTHGASTNKGFTQIVGRESANGDNVFRVSVAGSDRIHFFANGNGYFDGGADLGNADYAEYFEWADGNPDDEDRRGYSVVLVTDGKVRKATAEDSDDDFLGVVSAQPGIVGDAAWAAWTGRYKKDKFGARITEQYTMFGWGKKENEEDTWEHWHSVESAALNNIEIPDDAVAEVKERPIYADNYDPDKPYTKRKDRPEWSAIGMMGKLPLYKGQPTHSKWRKLFDLSDETEMWLVR